MRRRDTPIEAETAVLTETVLGEHATGADPTRGGLGSAPGAPGYRGAPGSTSGVTFTGTEEPEAIVLRVRRHGRHLVLPVIALLGVSAAGGIFIGRFPEVWMNLAAAAGAVLLAGVLGIGPVLAWLSRRAVVTTRRVIVHRGLLVRHRTEVSLARVREVGTRQTIVQRMHGSGDVDLHVGAERTTIADAPDVKHLHAALQELAERNYDAQLRAAGRFGF